MKISNNIKNSFLKIKVKGHTNSPDPELHGKEVELTLTNEFAFDRNIKDSKDIQISKQIISALYLVTEHVKVDNYKNAKVYIGNRTYTSNYQEVETEFETEFETKTEANKSNDDVDNMLTEMGL